MCCAKASPLSTRDIGDRQGLLAANKFMDTKGFPELSLNAVVDPESADEPHPQSAPTGSGARLGSIR